MQFEIEKGILKHYTGSDMHLVIPDNAKIIGKSAFADCRELVSVIVSSGTSRISGNAFENCISLESITIPSKVKVLGKDIFQNCRKLKYILVSGNPEDMKAHGWLGFLVDDRIRFEGIAADPNFLLDRMIGIVREKPTLSAESAWSLSKYAIDHIDCLADERVQALSDLLRERGSDHIDQHMEQRRRALRAELNELFLSGQSIPLERFETIKKDRRLFVITHSLIWQCRDVRFFMNADGCWQLNGMPYVPDSEVALAHPVEMDASEIIGWKKWISDNGIEQSFVQINEPVLLRDGLLEGKRTKIVSGKTEYEMSSRYYGVKVFLSEIKRMKDQAIRFIVREDWYSESIENVNIITPFGIFLDCHPNTPIESLSDPKNRDAYLVLKYFYPIDNIFMRRLNHAVYQFEACFLEQFLFLGLEHLMLPHLPSLSNAQLRLYMSVCEKGSGIWTLMDSLLQRREDEC